MTPGRGQGLHSAQPLKAGLRIALGGPRALETPSHLGPGSGGGTWQ